MLSLRTRVCIFVLLIVAALVVTIIPSNAFAATHYTTPKSHDKFTTQADKEHIVSVVINCIDGSVEADCVSSHYIPYLTLVYLWTSNNKSVAEYGCGYGQNHYVDQENLPPHMQYFTDKNGVTAVYPPKPGALTGRDLGRIKLDAFCFGITTDTSWSDQEEGDAIFNAVVKGLLDRVHTATTK